jgi:hypothetical protein
MREGENKKSPTPELNPVPGFMSLSLTVWAVLPPLNLERTIH